MPRGRPRKYESDAELAAAVRQKALEYYYQNKKRLLDKKRKSYEAQVTATGGTYHQRVVTVG